MAIPVDQLPYNVRYSLQEWIGIRFEDVNLNAQGNPLYPVNYDDLFFNPDQRDTISDVISQWVQVHELTNMTGTRGFALYQFDLISRIGTRETGDQLRRKINTMARIFRAIFVVKNIPLYDFTADQSNPVLQTDNCIVVQNSAGVLRGVEDHQTPFRDETEVIREILTYRFMLLSDYAKGHVYENGVT